MLLGNGFVSDTDCIKAFRDADYAARAFYEEHVVRGLPLIDAPSAQATFLWYNRTGQELSAVHLQMNRITDKAKYARGLMKRVPGTGLWVLTLALPVDLRASYGFVPIVGEIASTTPRPQHGRPPALIDPGNASSAYAVIGGRGWSIYAGPQAPIQHGWDGPATQAQLIQKKVSYAGAERIVYTYLPQGVEQAVPIVTITDADAWFGRLKLHHALERAITSGVLSPVIVTGPACTSVADRQHILGPNQDTISWLATDIASEAAKHARQAGLRVASDRRILTGQSLGGLTALASLLRKDTPYSDILAQSPSLWWSPENTTSPAGWLQRETDWITDALGKDGRNSTTQPTNVYLTIGRQEGVGIARVEKLATTLHTNGWRTYLRYYNGGHDYAWWRGALIDQLNSILHE